jgi:pimeloyl-ACP methyl ester carboxylesterase
LPYALNHPRLWYERRGSGEPLLLITGFTISSAIFDPIVSLYDSRFDCVRYDHRLSGRSGAGAPPFTSMPELAADAARLMDALDIESAHVYGVSMGGMVAQELALRFPERVRGLVIGCSTPGGPRAVLPTVKELAALALGTVGAVRKKGRPWLAAALFSDEFRREHPEQVRELLKGFTAHRPPPHGVLAHLAASIYHDTTSRLGQIQAPTLVMHGECDAMTKLENAEMMVDRIPDAELALVPGAGHAFGLEKPQLARDMLVDWFDRRGEIRPGRPRTGVTARVEPVTRAFGLPIGALRTGGSLAARVAGKVGGVVGRDSDDDDDGETHGGGRDVAADRRAA